MPTHVHWIAVPKTEDGLRRAIGESHRRYARRIDFCEKWRGYLWQGRFASFIMDEPYLLAAARYVELNPVRAKLVDRARRVAVEQCEGAPVGSGRPLGRSRTSIGDGRRLESVSKKCDSRGRTPGFARTWANRSAAGEFVILGPSGKSCWSCFETAKTRAKATTTQTTNKKNCELSAASPELPYQTCRASRGGCVVCSICSGHLTNAFQRSRITRSFFRHSNSMRVSGPLHSNSSVVPEGGSAYHP